MYNDEYLGNGQVIRVYNNNNRERNNDFNNEMEERLKQMTRVICNRFERYIKNTTDKEFGELIKMAIKENI